MAASGGLARGVTHVVCQPDQALKWLSMGEKSMLAGSCSRKVPLHLVTRWQVAGCHLCESLPMGLAS